VHRFDPRLSRVLAPHGPSPLRVIRLSHPHLECKLFRPGVRIELFSVGNRGTELVAKVARPIFSAISRMTKVV